MKAFFFYSKQNLIQMSHTQPNIRMKYTGFMNIILETFISWKFQLVYIYICNIKPRNCLSFQLLYKN